jgi:thymidylate synthase (FAD)
MKVTLLTHTPEPEKLVAAAARLCYSDKQVSEIMDNFTEEKVEKFIDKLVALGHESPLEHVSFTFGIEGISRACSHQLVRHRIASYSQKSQRYVNEKEFGYIVPNSIHRINPLCEFGGNTWDYFDIMDLLNEWYKLAIKEGMEPEDARMILPNACETSIIVTMNVRTLLNFFKHRDCNRAQWEIRSVAREMMKLCKEVAPKLFAKAGASCRYGKCSEGEMSCGEPLN